MSNPLTSSYSRDCKHRSDIIYNIYQQWFCSLQLDIDFGNFMAKHISIKSPRISERQWKTSKRSIENGMIMLQLLCRSSQHQHILKSYIQSRPWLARNQRGTDHALQAPASVPRLNHHRHSLRRRRCRAESSVGPYRYHIRVERAPIHSKALRPSIPQVMMMKW